MSAVSDFEKWMRDSLLATPEIEAAVAERVYNTVAPPNTPFPYLIFQVTPLEDRFGQARTSIQTRLFCDVQIYCRIPFAEAVDAAVEALQEKIGESSGSIVSGASSIAVRHDRPISRPVKGARADQHLIARGSTYKAWISRAGGA